jgi:Na+-transporting methylmalonyl-CoA/oxaloacetate decarboxylase gamma subunit
MDPQIAEGLRIMAVGIAGVFANLLLLMLVVGLFGVALGGKKKKKKDQDAPRKTEAAG